MTERVEFVPARTAAGRSRSALRRNRVAMAGAATLVLLYLAAVFAPFLAPYAENDIDRDRFLHPPTPLHWRADGAGFRLRPHVHATVADGGPGLGYRSDPARVLPLRWFVHGSPYRFLGIMESDRHLFGVDAPDRIFIMGADRYGRDEWTRLLFGARVSLTVGLVGILLSFAIGMLLGGIAGYVGGWVDTLVMRASEVLLSIPGLYLVIALRGAFPLDMPSEQVYLAIVLILSFIGWAVLARVIRGMVLSIRTTDYVLAAEALGLGRWRILTRHILPNTYSFVIVAATLAVPGYILGEVFLSFLGMGVQEPAASWGNMLQQSRSLDVMTGSPWLLFSPAAAIFLTVMAFNTFGDGLRDALDPRHFSGERAVSEPLLALRDLRTHFRTEDGEVRAVDGVSLELDAGETLALVGESGSGKSVTALSILRLLPAPQGRIVGGEIRFRGRDLVTLAENEMRAVRGREISMVFQEPMTSLNPVFSCGDQVAEVLELHQRMARGAAHARAVEMLELVGIPDPQQRAREYPHQLSGGMRQRVMIAMALACRPAILIADEPTTALDVTIQAQILELLGRLRAEFGMAVLFITHDLGVVAEAADRVAVLYAGQVVETADVRSLFARPLHPYTAGLLASLPRMGAPGARLRAIPGSVPDPADFPRGCRFHPRCPVADERCRREEPMLLTVHPGHDARCWRSAEIAAGTLAAVGGDVPR